jgi:hypoxanthine phosphoribosyltransferase
MRLVQFGDKLYSISNKNSDYFFTLYKDFLGNSKNEYKQIKEEMLKFLQGYYDYLLLDSFKFDEKKELKCLNGLVNIISESLGNYYNKNKIPSRNLEEYISYLESYNFKNIFLDIHFKYKLRHLKDKENLVKKNVYNLLKDLDKNNINIDYIFPIASGGFEPGLLIKYYLSLDSEKVISMRYSIVSRIDNSVKLFGLSIDEIKTKTRDKNVLISEDVISTGRTADYLKHWFNYYLNCNKIYFNYVDNFGNQDDEYIKEYYNFKKIGSTSSNLFLFN